MPYCGYSNFHPPLVAGHGDHDVLLAGLDEALGAEDRAHRRHGDEDDDEDRDRGPHDLEQHVAVGLPGDRVVTAAVAVADDHVHQDAANQQHHGDAESPGVHEQTQLLGR